MKKSNYGQKITKRLIALVLSVLLIVSAGFCGMVASADSGAFPEGKKMMHVKLPTTKDWAQRVQGLVEGENYVVEGKVKILSGTTGNIFDSTLRFIVRGTSTTDGGGWALSGVGMYTGSESNPINVVSYNEETGEFKLEFTMFGDACGNLGHAVGFTQIGNDLAEFYVADMKMYKKSEPDVNLFKNSDFENGLDYSWMGYDAGWGTEYLSDKNYTINYDKFSNGKFSYYYVLRKTDETAGKLPLEAWVEAYDESIFVVPAPAKKQMRVKITGTDYYWGSEVVLTKGKTYQFDMKLKMVEGTHTGSGTNDSVWIGTYTKGDNGTDSYYNRCQQSTHFDPNGSDAAKAVKQIVNDPYTCDYTYEFTYNGPDNVSNLVGFFRASTTTEFVVADLSFHEKGSDVELFKNPDFATGLDANWKAEWGQNASMEKYGTNGADGLPYKYENDKTNPIKVVTLEDYNESLFIVPVVENQMMHIDVESSKDWGQRLEFVKDTTYVAQFRLADDGTFRYDPAMNDLTTFFNVRKIGQYGVSTTFNGTNVPGSMTLVSYDKATSTYIYEFTYTEETQVCQIGFSTSAAADIYVSDMLLYNKADTAKTNLFKNADFANGLDENWVGNAYARSTALDGQPFGGVTQVCEKFSNGLYKSYTCTDIAITLVDFDEEVYKPDAVAGDVNSDDAVNLLDLLLVKMNLGGDVLYDIDASGTVDAADISAVRAMLLA